MIRWYLGQRGAPTKPHNAARNNLRGAPSAAREKVNR